MKDFHIKKKKYALLNFDKIIENVYNCRRKKGGKNPGSSEQQCSSCHQNYDPSNLSSSSLKTTVSMCHTEQGLGNHQVL